MQTAEAVKANLTKIKQSIIKHNDEIIEKIIEIVKNPPEAINLRANFRAREALRKLERILQEYKRINNSNVFSETCEILEFPEEYFLLEEAKSAEEKILHANTLEELLPEMTELLPECTILEAEELADSRYSNWRDVFSSILKIKCFLWKIHVKKYYNIIISIELSKDSKSVLRTIDDNTPQYLYNKLKICKVKTLDTV